MKKIEIYLVLLVLLFMSISNVKIEAQTLNLVPNPSFENFLDCPADVNCGAVYQIVDWYNIDVTPCPNGAPYVRSSPDYFNPCGQTSPPAQSQNAPNNFAGNQAGYNSTSSYAGFYTYHSSIYYPNYREYIGTTLPDVLKSNKQYILKMYLSLADNFNYATNGMGLHVGSTQTQISNNGYNNQWQCLNNLTPQLSVSTPITDKTNWVPVSTTITATGGERYITIGNFLNDNSVQIQSVGGTFMNSYYYIDQVSITPINFASPDVSVCPGSCTTLNADIGNFNITYQWSSSPAGFFSTSSTPTVCPTVATTYTVTATDANGGTATDAVVVSMLTPPDKPIISGYFNTCHGLTTYTITNYNQNFTYYYNINLGGTQVPFTSNQFNVNWASYPNGGVLYVTVTDNNGCTATDSLKVFECCSFLGLPQKNDETWTTAPSDPAFVVNGILTINGNVNLSNKEMNFGPNAKIVINPSYTLTLSNCTLKAVCRVMWDGIFINQSNSSLIVNNNTQIHNAKNAIVSNNCGIYQLSNNVILEANYKNIIVSTCPTTFNGSVSKTTFNGASQIMDQYPPILSSRTYSGIEINNVESIVVGNTTLADNRNVFYNMDFGIKNYCSNLEVYNNTFQNMSFVGSPTYPPTGGVGIISTATKLNNKSITIGGISNGTFNTNNFESCFWGVYADYYQNVIIQRDTFNSTVWNSIYLYNHPSKTIKVLSNVITDGIIGIHNGHCFNSTIDINSNRVTNTYYGIVAQNVNPGVVQKLNIYDNRVWNNTYGNGIWTTNIQGVQGSQTQIALISNNYVYMNNANLTQPSNGILVENCPYAFIQLNSVSKSSYNITTEAQALNLNGIYVQLSPNSDICQNSLLRMGCGLRFYGAMPNSKVKRNAMSIAYYYGVRLDNANIGTQGDATYAWRNSWVASSSNYRVQGTASISTSWHYDGSFGQSNPYCPYPNNVIPTLSLVYKSNYITSCSIPVQLPLSMQYNSIVSNSNNYLLTPNENKYWDEQHFYQDMQNSPGLLGSLSLSNSAYQSFYNNLSSSNIGLFAGVTDFMNNESFSAAELLNTNISPVNIIEINRKKVNQIYLDTWAKGRFEFTTNERNALDAIAYGEPVLGGDAVYSARVMLGISLPISSGANKKMEQPIAYPQNVVGSIYPNPTREMANLDYSLVEGQSAYLYLYNSMGTNVKSFFLNNLSNHLEFTIKDLNTGLYFYRIVLSNNKLLESNKLIILK